MERTTQPSPTEESPRRALAERGATLVEYALVFALVAVASLAAIEFLQTQSENEINNQAECVSDRPPPGDCGFAPVPADVSVPDPGFSPPTSAPPSPDEVPTLTMGTAGFDLPPAPWRVYWPLTLTQSVAADPPQPDEPVAGVRIRAQVRLVDPADPLGTLYTYPVECITLADGTCELQYIVEVSEVQMVELRVIGIDTSPAPPVPGTIASFPRPT